MTESPRTSDSVTGAALWTDGARTRFFIVPDDAVLPAGDFALRTITGRKADVDPAALAPFEVSEPQAKAWLEGEFGRMLDTARGAVDRFVDRLRGADVDPLLNIREPMEQLERASRRLIAAAPAALHDPQATAAIDALADRLTACAESLRELARTLHETPPVV